MYVFKVTSCSHVNHGWLSFDELKCLKVTSEGVKHFDKTHSIHFWYIALYSYTHEILISS